MSSGVQQQPRQGKPSSNLLPAALDFLGWSMGAFTGALRAASSFVPGAQVQTREIQNQFHAVEWFAFAGQRASLPADESLANWLRRTDRMDLDHRPWVTEGACFFAARREFQKGPRRGWLDHDYPEWTRTVLHTGLGLAVAELTFTNVSTDQRLAEAIAAFTALCLANSQIGYEGCALEQIGLIARHMHSSRVPAFDRMLAAGAPELRQYFWHGFGRGSYLSPGNFAPWSGSGWRTIQAVAAAAPDSLARNNAVSGASWAFTLANLRTPEVMQEFLKERGDWAKNDPAFVDGVRSGLLVWRQMQPHDPPFQRLEAIISRYFDPVRPEPPARGPTFRFDG
ncbi:MAG: hypothetical protein ABL967_07530 [Bryobacteraceae bacterium]